MLKMDPRFHIYSGPEKESGNPLQLLLFGGVDLEVGPYNDSTLTNEMSGILKDVTDSFYQAYEVKSIIRRPTYTELLCRIHPISGRIDRGCEDHPFSVLRRRIKERGHGAEDVKKLEKLSTKMLLEKKDTSIISHPRGCYFMHRLGEEFEPSEAEYFLKTLETLLLNLLGKNYKIQSGIESHFRLLRVDMEIIQDPCPYIS